jgi:N-acetylglucosaminyldiphosphoundecaprenol N-acetyl-beta-D-mannosaminyltransferase
MSHAIPAPLHPQAEQAPERRTLCLLGLPIDVTSMDEAVARVREAVRLHRPLFLSTPNLNFLVGSQSDSGFRQSVIDSDLSLADGMPLVWMSRLMGVPLPERVTGSDLFERLVTDPMPAGQAPLRVYFFGGPPGAAAAAAAALDERQGNMVCVGHASPGFGSVEDMSSPEVIDAINTSGADFLIVALGAAKGQAWIQRNRGQIDAPVISHLGAVVNFTAGTVKRAPGWIGKIGMEWLWRIKEEPALWRRYMKDAMTLGQLLGGAVLPQALGRRVPQHGRWAAVTLETASDGPRLVIRGALEGPVPPTVQASLHACARSQGRHVTLDLTRLRHAGPEFQGQLLLLHRELCAQGRHISVLGSDRVKRHLRLNRVELSAQAEPAA